MDIEYLLFLQDLRNATGGIFDEYFNVISKIAVDIMPLLPYLIFWAVDKSWGYRFLSVLWSGELVNGTIKLSACAYRPWIRDMRIEPAGDAKVAATGYSFPSGHTMCATAIYGTTAVWQRNKRRILSFLCVVMILLTGFSRNFLGVHTPQDVIVGFTVTALIVWVSGVIGKKLNGNGKVSD
ncbi:MAG: phosphatase PAP2 family protein, partial [Firmicutes bacterium]|nr:phosphatase PAP2 family protein [Bacillota bacterium]